jgi:hypothetical protein
MVPLKLDLKLIVKSIMSKDLEIRRWSISLLSIRRVCKSRWAFISRLGKLLGYMDVRLIRIQRLWLGQSPPAKATSSESKTGTKFSTITVLFSKASVIKYYTLTCNKSEL